MVVGRVSRSLLVGETTDSSLDRTTLIPEDEELAVEVEKKKEDTKEEEAPRGSASFSARTPQALDPDGPEGCTTSLSGEETNPTTDPPHPKASTSSSSLSSREAEVDHDNENTAKKQPTTPQSPTHPPKRQTKDFLEIPGVERRIIEIDQDASSPLSPHRSPLFGQNPLHRPIPLAMRAMSGVSGPFASSHAISPSSLLPAAAPLDNTKKEAAVEGGSLPTPTPSSSSMEEDPLRSPSSTLPTSFHLLSPEFSGGHRKMSLAKPTQMGSPSPTATTTRGGAVGVSPSASQGSAAAATGSISTLPSVEPEKSGGGAYALLQGVVATPGPPSAVTPSSARRGGTTAPSPMHARRTSRVSFVAHTGSSLLLPPGGGGGGENPLARLPLPPPSPSAASSPQTTPPPQKNAEETRSGGAAAAAAPPPPPTPSSSSSPHGSLLSPSVYLSSRRRRSLTRTTISSSALLLRGGSTTTTAGGGGGAASPTTTASLAASSSSSFSGGGVSASFPSTPMGVRGGGGGVGGLLPLLPLPPPSTIGSHHHTSHPTLPFAPPASASLLPRVVDVTDKQGYKYRLSNKVLGRGASGEVRLGLSHSGALVAVKIVEVLVSASTAGNSGASSTVAEAAKPPPLTERAKLLQRRRLLRKGISSEENVQQAMRVLLGEMEMLSRLRHACIVGYIGAVVEEGHRFMLLMEYTSGGSLKRVLDLFADSLTPDQAIGYLKDVLHGLVYLHSQRIVHRDVKPENVLLSVSGGCKLIDFGISKQVSAATRGGVGDGAIHVGGTPFYMPPEAFRDDGKEVTEKSDMWSFGIMLAQVWTRQLPWPENMTPVSIAFHLSRHTPGFGPAPRYLTRPPASPSSSSLLAETNSALPFKGSTHLRGAGGGSPGTGSAPSPSFSPLLPPTSVSGAAGLSTPQKERTSVTGMAGGWIMGEEVMEVFSACTQKDPDKRPTATAVLQMPLFKKPTQVVLNTVPVMHMPTTAATGTSAAGAAAPSPLPGSTSTSLVH